MMLCIPAGGEGVEGGHQFRIGDGFRRRVEACSADEDFFQFGRSFSVLAGALSLYAKGTDYTNRMPAIENLYNVPYCK